MFRRLKRKILPRKTGQRISNVFSRVTGVALLGVGVLILLWGLVLRLKPGLADSLPANVLTNKSNCLIIGLGVSVLGFSFMRMHRQTLGHIETQFLKKKKR